MSPPRKRPKGKPGVLVPRPRPNRLKQLRERGVKLSQVHVAKLLGLTDATVSRHESGERTMTRDQITAYAQLYGVPSYEIFIDPAPEEVNEVPDDMKEVVK